jgi:peptidoglycan/xylan/chitin deacetylase (PgdA/CDA1 family)
MSSLARCCARQAVLACCGLLLLGGCADVPLRPPSPPASAGAPASGEIARDDDFVLVRAAPGDSAATLAARYLGDRAKAFWIVERNGGADVTAGEIVTIPLRPSNPYGVDVGGFQTIPILSYHRFGPRAAQLTVTPGAFEAQMAYLARNGYSVVPLARLPAFLQGKEPLPRKTVVLTIDDGYRSTYDVAYPILARYGFPATLFLYSDFIGAPDAVTWAQMKEMQASGVIDVQPHSKTHANLALKLAGESDAQYRDRLRREIDAPVGAILNRLGAASLTFAYPYGDVNDAVIEQLKRRDVAQGVTVTTGGNGFFAYPYYLRRSMVYGTDSIDAFKAKLPTFTRFVPRS